MGHISAAQREVGSNVYSTSALDTRSHRLIRWASFIIISVDSPCCPVAFEQPCAEQLLSWVTPFFRVVQAAFPTLFVSPRNRRKERFLDGARVWEKSAKLGCSAKIEKKFCLLRTFAGLVETSC